ncbi:MAG: heme-binding protein [Proteobacteria bacterium]|nr:heme-binding protein [Pseudomonadota bacterium]
MTVPVLVHRVEVGLAAARTLVDAAIETARSRGVALAFVVVDGAGAIVEAVRMDGAQVCAMPLAIDKAYTAVACGLPTAAWSARTQPGQADWGLNTALAGRLVAFAGGVPLYLDGRLAGGLGVSGAPAHVDQAVAEAAAAKAGFRLSA